VIAAGIFSVEVARRDPAYSFAGTSVVGRVALLAAGFALAGAGLAYRSRTRGSPFGPLLVAGSLGWLLLEWNSDGVTSSVAFTAGLVLYAPCPAFVGHAVLVFPDGRLSSLMERVAVAVAYAGTVLVLGLLPTVLFDPAADCDACARNLLLVNGHGQAADDLLRAGVWLGVVWASALALLVVLKGARASRAALRSSWIVLSSGAVYLSLVAAMYAASISHGLLWNGSVERRLWLGQAFALVAVVLGVVWSWARARRGRSAVARLVVELLHSPPP